jgi:hypothetical protein
MESSRSQGDFFQDRKSERSARGSEERAKCMRYDACTIFDVMLRWEAGRDVGVMEEKELD